MTDINPLKGLEMTTKQDGNSEDNLMDSRFFEYLDRINNAIRKNDDIESMMKAVLDEVLDIFQCDRASLVYPCDPNAKTWTVPMERFRPGCPGVLSTGKPMPMTPEVQQMYSASIAGDEPVVFGIGTYLPISQDIMTHFKDRSGIGMAIYPKNDKPWGFSITQCNNQRQWSKAELRMFKEVGYRLTEGLTSLLAMRELYRTNNHLRAISDCHQAIMHAQDEERLLHEVCRIICEKAEYLIAWVGFLPPGCKRVEPKVWAGIADDDILKSSFEWGEGAKAPCLVADVVNTGDTAYVDDVFNDGRTTQHLDNASKYDFRGVIILPLKGAEGEVFGVLVVYSPAQNLAARKDIELLEELAGNLSFGIRSLRAHIETSDTKRQLEASEERFRLTLEAVGFGVWEWDVPNDTYVVSSTYYTMLGYEPLDGLANRAEWLERLHPDDRTVVMEQVRNVLFGHSSEFTYEARILNAEGVYRWQRVKGYGVTYDDDGNVRKLLGLRMDVDDEKRAVDALAASEHLHRLLLDSLTQNVFYKNLDSQYITSNKIYAQTLGIEVEDIVGKTDDEFFPQELVDRYRADDIRVIHSGDTIDIEEPYLERGVTKWVHTVKTPIKDTNGNITGVLGIFWDITRQKMADEALKRKHRALQTLSAGNEALVRATDRQQLLQEMCRVIVAVGGYEMAWVGFKGDDSGGIKLMAQSRKVEGDLENDPIISTTGGAGEEDPTHSAMCLGKMQVVHNISSTHFSTHWAQRAAEQGYQSVLALPLNDSKGATFGALTIYTGQTDTFDEDEIKLLDELATDLAYGFGNLRVRKERIEAMVQLREGLIETIRAISATLEKRDPYTGGHQNNVSLISVAIAQELGLDEERIEGIRFGALIHDIGKIVVPAEILTRPGRLSEPEFMIIKQHPQVGYDIVKDIKFPWPVAQMIVQHHERIDGSGYPNGLKGDEILLESKIIAVADTVDAISSHRPYRASLGVELALKEIEKYRGIMFDPVVTDACLRLFREKQFQADFKSL